MFAYLNYLIDMSRDIVRCGNAVRELNGLTDKELNDLGITRGEIFTKVYMSTMLSK